MRTPIIVGFIAVSLTTLAVQSSRASIVSANWDIKNETGQTAYDFHVDVIQPNNHPTNWVDGAFKRHSDSDEGPPHRMLTWDDGTVPNMGSTHVGVEFDTGANEARVHEAFWTDKDGKKIGDGFNFPAFENNPLFGQIEFSVIDDDTDTSLVFHNLQFQTRSSHTPLDQLIPYTLPGFGASVPDFTLSPGQSMTFDIEAGVDDFVLAQMITYNPLNPAVSTVGTVFQDGSRVPEPATWAMTLLGFAGLGYAGLRRAQVRRRAAGIDGSLVASASVLAPQERSHEKTRLFGPVKVLRAERARPSRPAARGHAIPAGCASKVAPASRDIVAGVRKRSSGAASSSRRPIAPDKSASEALIRMN